MIFQLDERILFPNPRLGEPDGFFAVGGDLSIPRLLLAYRNGIFPWYSFRDWNEIHWYCPMKRFVIFPSEIHVSHSMRTLMRKDLYKITINKAFPEVIHACGIADGRDEMEGAWLGPHIEKAYTELHRMGYALSVEVWQDENLVGGLYGVTMGRAFIGESMFSLVPSGSKFALIYLARAMQASGGSMIDCQLHTPHLESMGARYIDYDEYMKILTSP